MTEPVDVETGVVRAGSRAPEVRPPGLRFRPRVDPRELEEFGEESRVEQASQNARSFFSRMRTRLGTEYERVPAEQEVELTELQDIEFGNIEAAEGVEEQAAQTVTRASAEADVEMQEFTDISAEAAPELVEAPEAIAGLTEISGAEAAAITGEEALAVGGETMASAFGVAAEGGLAAAEAGEVGIEGGLAAMEAGEVGLASAAEGAGIELGVVFISGSALT